MKSKVRFAVIGVSGRGRGMMENLLSMEDVEVTAVCDVYEDRVERAAADVLEKSGKKPFSTLDYNEAINRSDVDAVLVTTSWQAHIKISIAAMKAGKWAASEVGGASSVEECKDLVRVSLETGVPCMMLENCCYGREELALLNLAKKGIFGEIVHCRAGYMHDLRDEVSKGHINRHYRLDHYMHRNGDVYPMHGALPMGKILNVNRGNRFVSLVSVASKARGLNCYIKENFEPESELQNFAFAQGDVVNTIIKCAHGETLLLTHDTTLPRPYSRSGYVQGTKGLWMEENYSIYVDGQSESHKWESFKPWIEKYEHPLWKWFQDSGVQGGHGGMDYLVLRAFVESFKDGKQPPIDVFDFATYAAITPLSEASIAAGSAPQPFPDFTDGLYLARGPERAWKYGLSEIAE